MLFRAELGLPRWSVHGTVGRARLRVEVEQPAGRCVRLDYADPDGAAAMCTNTELANAEVVAERRVAGRWELARAWRLEGTAHAEIGDRPGLPAR